VLVADDYPDLLVAFKRLLAPSCDVVGCVADGTALCETMASLQPDVIVVDLFIPPSNGLEICRHIKQVAPETPVIIVSASTDAEVGKKALRAGASAFVAKMSAVEDLLPAIQRATATRTVLDVLEPGQSSRFTIA
jgi:DNA-binding NarL/FixJ family response regulator